ncbi:MFS transporter [Tardiphaga sp. 285_C5_N1_2]|uniref:MFS transporter n=1 Tax=Tardiphaga sp. 285_C5_N1_2 TaxID=3240775 RepID=UPI003F8CB9D0
MSPTSQSAKHGGALSVLFAVCLAALTLPLSFSGGAIATPAIGRDLAGSAAMVTWITNAFMLTFGSLLLTAGTLADRFGRRRIFAGGVALFVAASIASIFAPTILAIDLLRAVQGVGAAAALAGGSAAIAQEFEGHARTKAFSMLGTTFGIGLAFGPVIMGLLIERYGWRSIFVTTAVVGLVAIMLGVPRMRETRDPDAARLDWPGVITFTGALSLFTFAVIEGASIGWGNPIIVGAFTGSVALLAAFVAAESRNDRPMLDLSLFKYPRFVGVQLLPISTCFSYVVLLILLPIRFVGIEGLSEIEAGLMMLALSAPMLVVPYVAAVMTRWVSPGVLSAIGLLVASVGMLWLGSVAPGTGVSTISPLLASLAAVPAMIVIGFGAAIPWGLMDGLSVSVVPKERSGMASGIFNTSKVANEGISLAIVTAALGAMTAGNIERKVSLLPSQVQLLPEIAQGIVAGDLSRVARLIPEVPHSTLVQAYFSAFQSVSYVLASITFFAAIVIFVLLGRTRPTELSSADEIRVEAPAE